MYTEFFINVCKTFEEMSIAHWTNGNELHVSLCFPLQTDIQFSIISEIISIFTNKWFEKHSISDVFSWLYTIIYQVNSPLKYFASELPLKKILIHQFQHNICLVNTKFVQNRKHHLCLIVRLRLNILKVNWCRSFAMSSKVCSSFVVNHFVIFY